LIEEATPKGAAFVAQGGRQDRGGFLRAREAARRVKAQRNILRSDAQRGFAAPSRRERLGRTIPPAGLCDLTEGAYPTICRAI